MVIKDIDGFSAFLLRNDRRTTTIRKHTNLLKILGKQISSFDVQEITQFLLRLKEKGCSNSYLNSFVNAIRLYAQYTKDTEELQHLKGFNKQTSIKATFSDAEVEAFLALPVPYHADKARWKIYTVFWHLIAFTGMRPGECAKLRAQDIDFGRGIIQIVLSKTNQPGIVPIAPNIRDKLQVFIEPLASGEFLFPSKQGGRHYSMGGDAVIDNVDWHYDFKKRLKLLKLKRPHLTPYSFRHSYATRLLEENISLFHVKKLMRHRDLKSTLVYEHLTTKDLIEAQQKLPLIRKHTDPKKILQAMVELVKAFHLENDARFEYRLIEQESGFSFECNVQNAPKTEGTMS